MACLSFAANELLYYIALQRLHWHYFWSLAGVLVLVAIGTFVMSKFWAFPGTPQHMSHIPSISRAILLCADDYALHPLVDDAVQQLARAGRLSATSCMTTSPQWRQAAPALKPLRPLLSVGLHFNLN